MAARKRNGCRSPRTTQERRANGKRSILKFDEYEVRIRNSRSAARLPTSYDDIWVTDVLWLWHDPNHICWKKKRKTKWKRIPNIIGDEKVKVQFAVMYGDREMCRYDTYEEAESYVTGMLSDDGVMGDREFFIRKLFTSKKNE